MENNNDKVKNVLDTFLNNTESQETDPNMDCSSGVCILKDRSIVERINKKIITQDGRQLIM